MKKVCVAGLWHLGLVSAAGLAELGYDVVGVDLNTLLIDDLARGHLPIFEPGLGNLIKAGLASRKLRFENNLASAVSRAGTVLVTYDTPVDDNDDADLTMLEETFRTMIPALGRDCLVIVNSQVPAGSCEIWLKKIEDSHPGEAIDLVYSPENLRLGQALSLFKRPDMIVIGAASERARKKAEKFYRSFAAEKIFTSLKTAEMAKHALNAFFATSVSFANELGNICEAVGADGLQIAKILKKDGRIGARAQVRPGLGFAGATLARDLRVLQKLGRREDVATGLFDRVLEINGQRNARVVKLIEDSFGGQLQGKTISILGLTYKPGTSTLRRSSSLEIMKILHSKGARILSHDPKADIGEYPGRPFFEFFADAYSACQSSDAILLLTEWPEYKKLDYLKIKKSMNRPLILDAKNHLNETMLEGLGFEYQLIGRPREGMR